MVGAAFSTPMMCRALMPASLSTVHLQHRGGQKRHCCSRRSCYRRPGAYVTEDTPGAVSVRVAPEECLPTGNGFALVADPSVKVQTASPIVKALCIQPHRLLPSPLLLVCLIYIFGRDRSTHERTR
jgi:hypothetical protein